MIQQIPTKDLIAMALKDLLKDQYIANITINEIVNHCHLSKRTFYNHFSDKYSVLDYLYDLLGKDYDSKNQDKDHLEDKLSFIFSQMKKDRVIYQHSVTYSEDNEWLRHVLDKCMTFLRDHTNASGKINNKTNFEVAFFANGTIIMVKKWILSGMVLSEEQLSHYIVSCLPDDIKQNVS